MDNNKLNNRKIQVHILNSEQVLHFGFSETGIIHMDDTIETIKKKIIVEINKTETDNKRISFDEMYLFVKNTKQVDLLTLYNAVTNDEKMKISPQVMHQLCLNMGKPPFKKEIERYEDFYEALDGGKHGNQYSVCCPIGIEIAKKGGVEFLFPVNPLTMVIPPSYSTHEIHFYEQKLLFEYSNTNHDVMEIYVCLVRDLEKQNLIESETNLFRFYFPHLYDKKIVSFALYHDANPALILETESFGNESTMVDWMYDETLRQEEDIVMEEQGIRAFTLYILPRIEKTIPLEIIFKNIHANATVPLIYYPTMINNTFRLYCDRLSTNGKKIPLLEKNHIMRLWREMEKNKKITGINREYVKKGDKITLFIQTTFEGDKLELFMDFKPNGVITVYSEKMDKIVSLDGLNALMKQTIHPIIESLNTYLNETGFKIEVHDTIEHNPYIKIENIVYALKTHITGDMKIQEILECCHSFFLPIHIQPNHSELIYKRVSQFKRMNAKAYFVSQQIDLWSGKLDIETRVVSSLMKQFTYLTKPEAQQLFRNGLEQHDKTIEAPSGFVTLFDVNERKELTIEFRSITDVSYLSWLNTYIQGLLKMSGSTEWRSIMCNQKKEEEGEEEDEMIEEELYDLESDSDSDESGSDSEFDSKKKKRIGYTEQEEEEQEEEEGEQEKEEEEEEEEEQEEEEGEQEKEEEEEEEEQEEEEEEEEEEEKNKTEKRKNEKTIKISTLLLKRFQDQAPKLLKKGEKEKDSTYSRQCPGDNKPVILTTQEKNNIDTIDEKYGKSYEKALFYEYDKKTNFYFICPRYWSVNENRSISEKELKEGELSKKYKVITRKTEKDGGNVYEFTAHNKKKGNRIPELKSLKNAQGMPLPCCYEMSNKEKDKQAKPISEYISERPPPIEKGRLGFLPSSLELFFNIKRSDFFDMKKPRLNVSTLLRCGTGQQQSSSTVQQSFLSCFADIYSYLHTTPTHNVDITVNDLLKKIKKGVGLDRFVQLQNSSLVSVFRPLNINYGELRENIYPYQETLFFKTIDLVDDVQERFLLDTIASYENFLHYINDPTITKDHTYLWDIFTTNNTELFGREINLIVLQMVEDDSTEKIKIVCPSSLYSSTFYNKHNENVILMKKDNYYEPICVYKEFKNTVTNTIVKSITKTFNYGQLIQMKMGSLVRILETINENVFKKCIPSLSLKLISQNISTRQLYQIIKDQGKYIVKYQVLHFNHKVVGFYIEDLHHDNEVFVPCRPSAPIDEIFQVTYIDNPILWKPYDETVEQLERVYAIHDKKIPCRPVNVVVETHYKNNKKNNRVPIRRLVVGIMTETNQFVQVVQRPYHPDEHTLPILEQSNTNTIDKIVASTGSTEDNERVQVVNRILFEGQFYAAFRTTLRFVLNDYMNRDTRKEILHCIESDRFYYREKLHNIQVLLRKVSQAEIEFTEYDGSLIDEIVSCVQSKKCSTKSSSVCVLQTEGDICQLNIPKKNLVNGEDNETYYYLRLADELLRYKRIQFYMFENTINMVDIDYKIREDELIVIKNLLIPEDKNSITYFDNLETFQKNKYVHAITYDNAQPYLAKPADEVFSKHEKHEKNENECIVSNGDVIGNIQTSVWKKYFTPGKEIVFSNETSQCTFEVLLNIWQTHYNESVTVQELKTKLVTFYKRLAQYLPTIVNIWYFDNKIKKNQIDTMTIQQVEETILAEAYFLTDIDIWIVADALHLPIVLFCTTGLKLLKKMMGQTLTWIVCSDYDADQLYFFIRSPSEDSTAKTGSIRPKYHLITPSFKPTLFGDVKKAQPIQSRSIQYFLANTS
jgi:hypothetical protein